MKHLRKLLTLVVALVMTLGLVAPVFAEGEGNDPADPADPTPTATPTPDYDHPLAVTGLAEKDVANFYQVIEWAGEDTDAVAGWKAVAPFATVLTKEELTKVLLGTPATAEDVTAGKATKEGELINPTGITAELAGRLAKCVTAETEKTAVTVGKDGKAELDNKEAGMWMAIITPADPDTVYNPVFVAADYNKDKTGDWAVTEEKTYSDEAAAKKSTIPLTKTAKTTEDNWDDKKWTTTAIGDTVSFTVDTKIPGYGTVYTNPVFKITDKLTDLALKTDTVTVVKPEGLTKDKEYTVTATAAGYTIEFKADYLKTLTAPTDVQVTYDAIVTTTAPVHVNAEKNEVSTEFSHNPSDESDHGFKKDATIHYTFTIDANGLGYGGDKSGKKTSEIVKVGVDANGNPITTEVKKSEITEENEWKSPLADAEFKLYTDAECKNEYKAKKSDGTVGDPLTIKTGADGRMTITGLDAGTYYLQESKAPAGFVKDTQIHKIEIIATTSEKEITEYTTDGVNWISAEDYGKLDAEAKKAYKSYTYKAETLDKYEVKIDGQSTATYHFENKGIESEIKWTEEPPVEKPFEIKNTKGTELPSTGGMGTTLFYVVGTLLVLGAGVVLVSKRRIAE